MEFHALDHDSLASFERCVLDNLATTIGYDTAFFWCEGTSPTTVRLDVGQLVRALADPTMQAELAPVKRAAMSAHGVAIDTEVLGEQAVRDCTYFQTLAAPIGVRHSLIALVSLRGALFGSVMLGRCGSQFSPAQIEQIERWLPEITLSVASFFASPPYAPRPLPKPSHSNLVE